jgi:5-methylcytosine-specific restriction endonuclease McrA
MIMDVGFYDTPEWKELKLEILHKYGACCMACGARSPSILHVDHIKPRSLYPHLQMHPDNLQVLCIDCNIGKGDAEDDLRPTKT